MKLLFYSTFFVFSLKFHCHQYRLVLMLLDEQDEAVQGVARVGEYARECASSDENTPA